MNTKVKALIWEECRVGGSIAGSVLAVGLLMLVSLRISWGSPVIEMDVIFFLAVMGAPMAVALLLILNPDHSGTLAGGFSKRILRLPVRVPVAVATTLLTRTLLVFLVASLTVLASRGLFDDTFGPESVLLITVLYLGAQLADWLRAPVSGLNSLLVLLLAGIPGFLLINDRNLNRALSALAESESVTLLPSLVATVCAFAIAYAAAVPVVHLTRIGRRTGIPEIWEWPRRMTFVSTERVRAFSSPISARVWFEMRRSGWILPTATVTISVLYLSALWLKSNSIFVDYRIGLVPQVGMYLGAAAQGLHMGIGGYRKPSGNPGYHYLHPLTDAQFALARTVASAMSLLPVLLLVIVFYFGASGRGFLTEAIPYALDIGVATSRDVAWILLGHTLFAGLLAWILLACSTRLVQRAMIAPMLICTCAEILVAWLSDWRSGFSLIPLNFFLCAVLIYAYARAWRTGLLPGRTLAAGTAAWAVATWLIYANARPAIVALDPALPQFAIVLLSCMGMATLLPFPYVAVLLDLRRRRHGGSHSQDIAQHAHRLPLLGSATKRASARLIAAAVGLAILWLTWPVRPAYEKLWRDKGRPITLAELDASYAAVAPEENRALRFLELAGEGERLNSEFMKPRAKQMNADDRNPAKPLRPFQAGLRMYVLVVGSGFLERDKPIDDPAWNDGVWKSTEAYWQEVTSHVALAFAEVSASGPGKSRYPVDLREGLSVEPEHLRPLSQLGSELRLDALYCAVEGDTSRAADSLVAVIALGNSLAGEPIVLSQLHRNGMMSGMAFTLNEMLYRAELPEDDLARIQHALLEASPRSSVGVAMKRALIGDGLISMSYAANSLVPVNWELRNSAPRLAQLPVRQLIASARTEQVVLALWIEDTHRKFSLPWPEFRTWAEDRTLYVQTYRFARVAAAMVPTRGQFHIVEWRLRTSLELAATAVAIERFKLAHGRLPDTLDELTPAFLEEIPEDHFTGTGEPIRYRRWDDGRYVVYSVGNNMEDNLGVEMQRSHREGDITYAVAPPLLGGQKQPQRQETQP